MRRSRFDMVLHADQIESSTGDGDDIFRRRRMTQHEFVFIMPHSSFFYQMEYFHISTKVNLNINCSSAIKSYLIINENKSFEILFFFFISGHIIWSRKAHFIEIVFKAIFLHSAHRVNAISNVRRDQLQRKEDLLMLCRDARSLLRLYRPVRSEIV